MLHYSLTHLRGFVRKNDIHAVAGLDGAVLRVRNEVRDSSEVEDYRQHGRAVLERARSVHVIADRTRTEVDGDFRCDRHHDRLSGARHCHLQIGQRCNDKTRVKLQMASEASLR